MAATTHGGRKFDRFPDPSRNAEFPIRSLVGPVALTTRTRVLWRPGQPLDQGPNGACTGFGFCQEALTSPVRVDLTLSALPAGWPTEATAFARQAYWENQRNDQWPGGSYPGADPFYEGSSVVAGARTMVRLGFLREYRWAFTVDEMRDALLVVGPCVIGIAWRDGMFDAPGGIVHATGPVVGGHCLLINGYSPDRDLGNGPEPAFCMTNSWGSGWGVSGSAWLSSTDMASLLADDGEACVPTRRSYNRIAA